MNTFNLKSITVLFLLSITPLMAQERWSAEFRPGLNFSNTDLGETKLQTGFGFEIVVAYKVMPHIKAYAGWGWNEFKAETANSEPGFVVGESGYTFGFELTLPISISPLTYYLYGGGIYEHLEIEDRTTNSKDDTGHGLGWQIGGGLNYEFAPKWSVRPALKYQSLSGDSDLNGIPTTIDLRYVSFGIGLLRSI